MNPAMGWTEVLGEDGARLEKGVTGYQAYDEESRSGRAIAQCSINATPKQVMGLFMDPRGQANLESDRVEESYTGGISALVFPSDVATISDREVSSGERAR
jgi:hypothetical protein